MKTLFGFPAFIDLDYDVRCDTTAILLFDMENCNSELGTLGHYL